MQKFHASPHARITFECFRTLTSLAAAGFHDPEAALDTYTRWCPVSVSEVPLPVDKTKNGPGFFTLR